MILMLGMTTGLTVGNLYTVSVRSRLFKLRRNPHADDVMASILPEELVDDIPSGFNTVGHVGRPNLAQASHVEHSIRLLCTSF